MSHVATEAPTAPISSFVSDLDHLVADVMADWKVPGVALAVVQDGKVALTRAYGQRDVEAALPVTTVDEVILHQPNGIRCAARGGVERLADRWLPPSLFELRRTSRRYAPRNNGGERARHFSAR